MRACACVCSLALPCLCTVMATEGCFKYPCLHAPAAAAAASSSHPVRDPSASFTLPPALRYHTSPCTASQVRVARAESRDDGKCLIGAVFFFWNRRSRGTELHRPTSSLTRPPPTTPAPGNPPSFFCGDFASQRHTTGSIDCTRGGATVYEILAYVSCCVS